MLCGVEEPLDVQQLRLTARMEGFDNDFKERFGVSSQVAIAGASRH